MLDNDVQRHYTRGHLLEAVLAAIVESGNDPDHLDPEALAPVEEFHTLGRSATVTLAEAAKITANDNVLDVGSGLGGPARLLARRYESHVTGLDLTQELCDVAEDLTRRVGLSDKVKIRQGNALDLPFENDSFDVVWTQHVSMNIADKAKLFAEMRRVTKVGGRLAFFDILAGPLQPIHFPVPWADDESTSFLATVDETRANVKEAGFSVRIWEDLTQEAANFYAQLSETPPVRSPLGLHLLIPNMPIKGANLKRNVDEGRIVVIRCVADAV
ncbi:MAG: methyltransferase domain-containing protein [Ilumatobacteraceae bacterium]